MINSFLIPTLTFYFRDYHRTMPEFDTYDPELLDEEDYDTMSVGGRLKAEAEMRMRDLAEGRLKGSCKFKLRSMDTRVVPQPMGLIVGVTSLGTKDFPGAFAISHR